MMAAKAITEGMPLSSLLEGIFSIVPDEDLYITGISLDSRTIKPGDLFIACGSGSNNGIQYIDDAIKAGAIAVIVEVGCLPETVNYKVPVFNVEKLDTKTGIIAGHFYGQPSSELTIAGITGTNGKTSVSYLLAQALSVDCKQDCGLIGTLGYGSVKDLVPGPHTTPDPVTLQHLLADMRDQGFSNVVMEVSSHGLDQHRIAGVDFDLAVFTNLSRDHLDYHKDLAEYADAKKKFFTDYSVSKAVLNLDDELGRSILDVLDKKINTIAYTLVGDKDHSCQKSVPTITGQIKAGLSRKMVLELKTPWGDGFLESRLFGKFNAYNLMACVASLCLLGIPLNETLKRLSSCGYIPGRMEYYGGEETPQVIVDYAHTPDALEQMLQALKAHCHGKLFCVFGCGGDRDKGKRSQMGMIAQRYADFIILTNDNPRTEDPALIIQDIMEGIPNQGMTKVMIDRTEAIREAINMAGRDDIVLIAGKGHETYQEIGCVRHPFSDQSVVLEALESNT